MNIAPVSRQDSLLPSLCTRGAPRPQTADALVHVPADHPWREAVEAFVQQRFAAAYNARVSHFCPSLLACCADDRLAAVAGFKPAAEGALFLEHYLDRPAEAVLAAAFGVPVARRAVVEVGNFAAVAPGAARRIIRLVTAHLYRQGYEWAVFTATRELANAFHRLRLTPQHLAPADPHRLPGGAGDWGSYYDHAPAVYGGSIAAGFFALARR
jgi:hypothetical protein